MKQTFFIYIIMTEVEISSATGRQVDHSVEGQTLEAEVLGSKPMLGTWW